MNDRDMYYKGYVKSIRGGTTGIGATFEALIGKEEDKLSLPDFKGIEINFFLNSFVWHTNFNT